MIEVDDHKVILYTRRTAFDSEYQGVATYQAEENRIHTHTYIHKKEGSPGVRAVKPWDAAAPSGSWIPIQW